MDSSPWPAPSCARRAAYFPSVIAYQYNWSFRELRGRPIEKQDVSEYVTFAGSQPLESLKVAKRKGHEHAQHRAGGAVTEVIGRVEGGRKGWRLRDYSGDIKIVHSSKSSNAAMNVAVSRYDRALRRLADR